MAVNKTASFLWTLQGPGHQPCCAVSCGHFQGRNVQLSLLDECLCACVYCAVCVACEYVVLVCVLLVCVLLVRVLLVCVLLRYVVLMCVCVCVLV